MLNLKLDNFIVDGINYAASHWPVLSGWLIKDLQVPLDLDTGIDSDFLAKKVEKGLKDRGR